MINPLYNRVKNNSYRVKQKSTATVITLEEMKLYLRVDNSADDLLITMLIKSATSLAEKLMARDLLETVWTNLRNDIDQDMTLRRAEFLALNSIKYRKDGTYITLDAENYDVATGGIFAKIWELEIPEAFDEHPEAICIEFKTGFGASASQIPDDILSAIKSHVAMMYENRGDCIEPATMVYNEVANVEKVLPYTAMIVYKMYRVVDCGL